MEVKGGFEEKSFNREEFFIQFNFEHQNNNSMPLISIKKMLVLVEHTLLIVKWLFTNVFIAL